MDNLCLECKYAEWDVLEYYGNVGESFVCGCKRADKAETEENEFGEIIECSEYVLTPPDWK